MSVPTPRTSTLQSPGASPAAPTTTPATIEPSAIPLALAGAPRLIGWEPIDGSAGQPEVRVSAFALPSVGSAVVQVATTTISAENAPAGISGVTLLPRPRNDDVLIFVDREATIAGPAIVAPEAYRWRIGSAPERIAVLDDFEAGLWNPDGRYLVPFAGAYRATVHVRIFDATTGAVTDHALVAGPWQPANLENGRLPRDWLDATHLLLEMCELNVSATRCPNASARCRFFVSWT